MEIKNTIPDTLHGIVTGASCAVVTPFSGGDIDLDSFGKVLDHVLGGGIRSVVVCGTTGESPTLTDAEQLTLVRYAVEKCAGRAQVLCGASSNSSIHAARRAVNAVKAGADGVLCVTPYYNKASVDGMIAHYSMISDAVADASGSAGIILYNVPSRTGSALSYEVLDALTEKENIVGIKEASGDMRIVTGIISRYGDRFGIWSGCDELNQPIMACGGVGCISVLANVFPAAVGAMCRASLSGDHAAARRISDMMRPAVDALFCEVNPIPVKAAMADLGLCREEYRLPLCAMTGEKRKRVREAMERVRSEE